jgi:hypothetical protein
LLARSLVGLFLRDPLELFIVFGVFPHYSVTQ